MDKIKSLLAALIVIVVVVSVAATLVHSNLAVKSNAAPALDIGHTSNQGGTNIYSIVEKGANSGGYSALSRGKYCTNCHGTD